MPTEGNYEERILPPEISQVLFHVTIKQYEIQLYLDNKMRKGSNDTETRVNNWLTVHALSLYGVVRTVAFLLGRKCVREAQMAITNAGALLRQVVDYLTTDGKDLDRARELYDKVTELEAAIYLMMSRCTGIPIEGLGED
jgi:hypothetical protein